MTQENENVLIEGNATDTQEARANFMTGILPTVVIGAIFANMQKFDPTADTYFSSVFLPIVVSSMGLMMWFDEKHDIVKVYKGVAAGAFLSAGMVGIVDNYANLPDRNPEPVEVTVDTPRPNICVRYNVATGSVSATNFGVQALSQPLICSNQPAAPAASGPAP